MNERTPARSLLTRVVCAALLAAVALSMSSWFFLSMGKFTEGSLCAPLDDSFIYFQYARRISEGHGLSYSQGAGPTTGATSLPYAMILALGYTLGARGDNLILLSFVLGSCFLFLSALLVARIVETFSNWIVGTGAAVLLLVNGHVVWSYLSCMEVGLFGSAILLTLWLFIGDRQKGSFLGTSLAAAAMGLSRPEGFFLAVPVALLVLALSRQRPRSERIAVFCISLLGGLQFLLNFVTNGSFASTGAQAKSIFFTQEPDMWRLYMRRFVEMPGFVLNLFLTNFYSSGLGRTWALAASLFLKVGFLLAVFGSLVVRKHRNTAALVWLSWALLSIFLSLIPWAWNVHLHRYQVPFFPIFLVVAAIGYGLATDKLTRKGSLKAKAVSWVVLCFMFAVTTVAFLGTSKRMALIYAHNCENIFHQQVRIARWIRANTPSDVVVGLNDAGAIAYIGERRVYDFVGLVTPGQAMTWRSGIGSIVEALERLPADQLPGLLAIYPNWLPFLVNSGLAGEEIARAHLDLNTICGGTDKVVYLPDWSLLRTGDPPPPMTATRDLRLVDRTDVADLKSEKEHAYRVLGTWRPLAKVLRDSLALRQVLDGGRLVFGGEEMTVRCTPGKDLYVVARLDDKSCGLRLYVDGVLAGIAKPERRNARWSHLLFKVPREFLGSDRVKITTRLESEPEPQERSYGSYHYWFFQ